MSTRLDIIGWIIQVLAWALLIAAIGFITIAWLGAGCHYDSLIEVNIYGGGEKTTLDVLRPPDKTEPTVILETDDGDSQDP